jgi:arylsulfatase A-like enzyme
MYEGGIREPLLVRWPAVVKAGGVIGTPVSSPDVFPTLLEAANAKPQPGQVVDGVSLIPIFKGGDLPERPLFWHYPHYGNQGGAPSAAIRRGPWKLIHWMEVDRAELFDLSKDIGEQTDLAEKEPQRVAELRAELAAWQKQVGAKFPIPNPDYDSTKSNARAANRNPKNAKK